jgi:hypothetical protein
MGAKRKRRATIPQNITEIIDSQIEAIGVKRKRSLSYEIKSSYLYVYSEDKPLCRLGYTGDLGEWDFAIFKWSTETYSSSEFGFLASGTIEECVDAGLEAYPKNEIMGSRFMIYLHLLVGLVILFFLFVISRMRSLWRKISLS